MSKFPANKRRVVEAIRTAREAKGLSRRDLSLKMKQAHSFISRVERMQRNLTVEEFTAIAETLDIEPVELFRKTLRR